MRDFKDLEVGGVNSKDGQMKIMQMAFMIIAVFFFFVLVGLFVLGVAFKDVAKSSDDLKKEQAISSLEVIASMSEFSFDSRESMMLDEDKLMIMSGGEGEDYSDFFPVASLRVYKIYPAFEKEVKCPAVNCNYYDIYSDSGSENSLTYSSFVSICKRVKNFGSVYDSCEIGKIVVGVDAGARN